MPRTDLINHMVKWYSEYTKPKLGLTEFIFILNKALSDIGFVPIGTEDMPAIEDVLGKITVVTSVEGTTRKIRYVEGV